jgi:hypothetical protein
MCRGVRIAPILHELAPRLSELSAADARTDPVRWAYALREAVSLASPDVLVSHWDPALEADALSAAAAGADAGSDWVDRLLDAAPLAQTPPAAAAVELVGVLAGLYRSGPTLAAALTGPQTLAAALARPLLGSSGGDGTEEDRLELASLCADALASLVGAYGEAGAQMLVVVERDGAFLDGAGAAEAHSALLRAIAHHRLPAVLLAPEGFGGVDGYESVAVRWDGTGAAPAVAALAPEVWAEPPDMLAARWRALREAAGAADVLLLSDGPLPGGMPLENLQRAADIQ